MAEETVKPWGETKVVGKPITPVDAYERVSGKAVFPSDVMLPNMLYGAILHSPHPHAMVTKIDLAKAREMPGVRAVLSDADPEAKAVKWYSAMAGPGTVAQPLSRLFDPHCRYAGEEVAAVAADTPQQAWDAVRAIQVEYEELPFVVDMEKALTPEAPLVQEGGNRIKGPGYPSSYTRGSLEKGFAEADVVLEETYRTPCVIHSNLETHGSVADWDGDNLTVWDTTQGVFGMQGDIARAMNMPLSKLRVIGHYMGGGFGSKLEASKMAVIAALLAKKADRPVRLFLTREESYLSVGNRPSFLMKVKAGVKKDGTLTALQLVNLTENGAYPRRESAALQFQDLYKCPNVHIEETGVYINAGACRAMRGPGQPQGCFALEQMMDALAGKIGMDPVELRLKNITLVSQPEGTPYTSNGLPQSLTEGAQTFGWKEALSRPKGNGPWVRGVGVASGIYHSSGDTATAILKLYADGSANLNMGAADLMGGCKTVMAQIVSEELGIPLNRIQIEHADTATTQYTRPSGGSKTVTVDGPPVRRAALEVKRLLLEMAAEQLKVPVSDLVYQDGVILAQGGAKKLPITALTQFQAQRGVTGLGRTVRSTDKPIHQFFTQFAEVEVNTRTGELRVLRMLAAFDCGRVMNLLTYRNQLYGGMLFAFGLGVTERRVIDAKSGKMLNANFHDYKIATSTDVPEMTVVPIDPHDTECNILGVKGIGEPANIPGAAAIANAFYNATGIRATSAPLTPPRVLALLAQRQTRG